VRLDDPEVGEWAWTNHSGKRLCGTRWDYLREEWKNADLGTSYPELVNLAPRTQYGCQGRMRAGFKGMTFHTDDGIRPGQWGHEGIWVEPAVGIYFLATYKEYVAEHFAGRPQRWPYHPWLYIQLDHQGFGLPMTIPTVRKAWERALKRLGLAGCGLGPHSLRHLAGYYCANQLNLSLEKTKVLLRHASAVSTEKYFHLSKDEVRAAILQAGGVSDFLLLPSAPRVAIPNHWYGRGAVS